MHAPSSNTYQGAIRLAKWKRDPVQFVWDVWKVNPWADQVDPMRKYAEVGSRVSVRAGNGTGKTAMIPWLAFWALATHAPISADGSVQKTAVGVIGHASGEQLKASVWNSLRVWHDAMPAWIKPMFVVKEKVLQRTDSPAGAFFNGRTADKPEAMQGLRGYSTFYILDEASGIEDPIFEAAQSALTGPDTHFLAMGNPLKTEGWFKKTQTDWRNNPWAAFKMDYFRCPFTSPQWAADQLSQYGAEAPYYVARVLGDFPEASSDILIPLAWIEAACEREMKPGVPRVLGIDPAGMGDDKTAFVVREGAVITNIEEFSKQDEMQIVGRAYTMHTERRFDKIVVDAIGIGAGIASRLIEMGAPVARINVSEGASMFPHCHRLRDELWWRTRDALYNKTLAVSPDVPHYMREKLKAEMSTVRYGYMHGKTKVESKTDLRKRGVRSPNIADAFNLTGIQGYAAPIEFGSSTVPPTIIPSSFPYA